MLRFFLIFLALCLLMLSPGARAQSLSLPPLGSSSPSPSQNIQILPPAPRSALGGSPGASSQLLDLETNREDAQSLIEPEPEENSDPEGDPRASSAGCLSPSPNGAFIGARHPWRGSSLCRASKIASEAFAPKSAELAFASFCGDAFLELNREEELLNQQIAQRSAERAARGLPGEPMALENFSSGAPSALNTIRRRKETCARWGAEETKAFAFGVALLGQGVDAKTSCPALLARLSILGGPRAGKSVHALIGAGAGKCSGFLDYPNLERALQSLAGMEAYSRASEQAISWSAPLETPFKKTAKPPLSSGERR